MKSSLVIWRNCWRWRLCMWQIASFSLHPTASIRTVECTAIQYKPCTLYNVLERVDCKRRWLCGSRNYAAYEYVYVLPTTNCTDAVCFYANCNAPMEHTKRERETLQCTSVYPGTVKCMCYTLRVHVSRSIDFSSPHMPEVERSYQSPI